MYKKQCITHNAAEPSVFPDPMVRDNLNNYNISFFSEPIINENQSFLSEQFIEDNMQANVKQRST